MQSSIQLVSVLNKLLAHKLTAISQYMLHAEMCLGWGYELLHKAIDHQVEDELKHAEHIIRRILSLGSSPELALPTPINAGSSVFDIVSNEQESKLAAIQAYNSAIGLAQEASDHVTAELLTEILQMEQRHWEWTKKQRTQIEQMGIEHYLANQTAGAAS